MSQVRVLTDFPRSHHISVSYQFVHQKRQQIKESIYGIEFYQNYFLQIYMEMVIFAQTFF